MISAAAIIRTLNMRPHPEGGHFVETFRDEAGVKGRAHATAIYFLLQRFEVSHWHRIDATEIWLWHAGAPIELKIDEATVVLGRDIAAGERPQAVVPAHAWQSARSLGDWTLVSCVVAPGFEYAGFELAPPNFAPQ